MSAIHSLPIRRKLAIAFGIVCALCLSLGTYRFIFQSTNRSSVGVSQGRFPAFITLTDMSGAMNQHRLPYINLLLRQAGSRSEAHEQTRERAIGNYRSLSPPDLDSSRFHTIQVVSE